MMTGGKYFEGYTAPLGVLACGQFLGCMNIRWRQWTFNCFSRNGALINRHDIIIMKFNTMKSYDLHQNRITYLGSEFQFILNKYEMRTIVILWINNCLPFCTTIRLFFHLLSQFARFQLSRVGCRAKILLFNISTVAKTIEMLLFRFQTMAYLSAKDRRQNVHAIGVTCLNSTMYVWHLSLDSRQAQFLNGRGETTARIDSRKLISSLGFITFV